ncbi:hypothetical protein KIN20_026665 [Parelaphostrongylus tenuis]|uniref:Peptidase S1 domain-containing protein n=1 Tax=Parelaphostrongylus tenuis TaxID=148309 RepID=A0AAD5QYA4_PARTN|nr:hypothetical protein KIN20_026665 [Parelaphostrongylus tenuis]
MLVVNGQHTSRSGCPVRMLLLALLMFVPTRLSKNITAEENLYLKEHCGDRFLNHTEPLRLKRSLGGILAKQNEFPWIAAFYLRDKATLKILWGCSGVQISPQHVLTAAHCVVKNNEVLYRRVCIRQEIVPHTTLQDLYIIQNPALFTLFIGSGCTNPKHCMNNRTNYSIVNIIVYEDYNHCLRLNDLAILEITPNISSKDGSPVCMPEQSDELMYNLTAVGFGIDPSSTPKPYSLLNLSDLRYVELYKASFKFNNTIAAVHPNRSVCEGDSGGPLVQPRNEDANYTVEGLAVRAFPECEDPPMSEERVSLFVDLRKFLDWICLHTGVCPLPHTDVASAITQMTTLSTTTINTTTTHLTTEGEVIIGIAQELNTSTSNTTTTERRTQHDGRYLFTNNRSSHW